MDHADTCRRCIIKQIRRKSDNALQQVAFYQIFTNRSFLVSEQHSMRKQNGATATTGFHAGEDVLNKSIVRSTLWRSRNSIADCIYTTDELVEAGIYTTDFDFMDKPGEYIGTLLIKGSSYRGLLRLFFLLEDGRQIITPVFKWQKFLGFFHIPVGTKLLLTYVNGRDDKVYLKKIAMVE